VLVSYLLPSVSVSAGQTLTVVVWVSPADTSVDAQWVTVQLGIGWNSGLGTALLRLRRTTSAESPAGVWKGFFGDDLAAWTASAFSVDAATKPTLLACHIDPGTNTMALFVDGTSYSATVSGTLPTDFTLLHIRVGEAYAGAIGHLQIYRAAAGVADYTIASQRAQYAAAWDALEGQFAGDRITTLARYAGISPADVAIDQGTAAMQKASLAGKPPLAAMQAAADADRGLLHADGRRLIFHSRKRRYDL
jgi:hypothetical protein